MSLRFFDMRRERHNFLTFPSNSTTCGTFCRPPTSLTSVSSKNHLPSASIESQLQLTQPTRGARCTQSRQASPRSEYQLTVFFSNPQNPQRFWAWRHSRPQFHFLFGVFIVISLIVTSALRAWTPALNVCT